MKLKIQLLLGSNLRYCAITEVKTFLTEVIQPGDILLSINNMTLLYQASEDDENFDSADISKKLTDTSFPCVIRLLRLGGNTTNFKPSPVEIALLQQDEKCTAKFLVNIPVKNKEPPVKPSIDGAVAASSSDPAPCSTPVNKAPSIELRYMDQNAPACIKKMMQGMKVQWDYIGQASAAPAAAPPSTSSSVVISSRELDAAPVVVDKTSYAAHTYVPSVASNYSVQNALLPFKDDDGLIRGGLFKHEKNKWGVYLAETISTKGMERVHQLGNRFESETEARSVYQKAAEELRTTGFFNQTRFMRLLSTPAAAPAAPQLTISLAAAVAAAQQAHAAAAQAATGSNSSSNSALPAPSSTISL